MDLANAGGQAIPKPTQAHSGAIGANADAFDISNNKGPGFAIFICWVTVLASIAASIFFWMMNNSVEQAIKEKSQEKNDIVSQIASPDLANVEKNAMSLKSAVTELAKVNKTRYMYSEFLPLLYARLAKNITVKNLSFSADGTLSLSGSTDTYRSVSDQMVILKEWQVNNKNIFRNVQLMSVNQGVSETTKKMEVTFLITGVVDKTQSLVEKPKEESATVSSTNASTETDSDASATSDVSASSSAASASDSNSEGGSDATIQ